jgi:parallel beta-helix repeat protein
MEDFMKKKKALWMYALLAAGGAMWFAGCGAMMEMLGFGSVEETDVEEGDAISVGGGSEDQNPLDGGGNPVEPADVKEGDAEEEQEQLAPFFEPAYLTLYVKSDGSDSGDGTKAAPLQTVQAALVKVAEAYGDSENPWPEKGEDTEESAEIVLLDQLTVSATIAIAVNTYPPLILSAQAPNAEGDLMGTTTLISMGGTTLTLRNITLKGGSFPVQVYGGCLVLETGAVLTGGTVYGVNLVSSGKLIMKDGAIIRGNSRGVHMDTSSTFDMFGGTISKNESGGGVYVYHGTFTMYGGTISNNIATGTRDGGGVNKRDTGMFTMYGGTIDGNTARNGGGVYLDGTFTMYGGTISNNISTDTASGYGGGGVYANGTFTMTSGTISGNIASGNGGGVFIRYSSTFTKSGNSIIYGAGAGANANHKGAGATYYGAAVYTSKDAGFYRDTTLGIGENISTANTGDESGWTSTLSN